VSVKEIAIVPESRHFSHVDACYIGDLVANAHGNSGATVVVDLRYADEATTSAFARLVLVRRALLKLGRDLRLHNLRSKVAGLYEVNRLSSVLPRI
jgi:ABC-type transporter Mla MlaB component